MADTLATKLSTSMAEAQIRRPTVHLILFSLYVLLECSSQRCTSVFEKITAIKVFREEINYRL